MSEFYSIGEKVLVTNATAETTRKGYVLRMGCGEVLVEFEPLNVCAPLERAWIDIERVERS